MLSLESVYLIFLAASKKQRSCSARWAGPLFTFVSFGVLASGSNFIPPAVYLLIVIAGAQLALDSAFSSASKQIGNQKPGTSWLIEDAEFFADTPHREPCVLKTYGESTSDTPP